MTPEAPRRMPWSVWLVIALCLAAQLSRRDLPVLKHPDDNYTPAETDPRGLTRRLERDPREPAAGTKTPHRQQNAQQWNIRERT